MKKQPHFWLNLPDEIRTRFGQKHAGRQRAMTAHGHLLLVLHKVPQGNSREREAAFFWRKPDGSWESTYGIGQLKLFRHVEEYEAAEAKLSQEYEQASDAAAYFKVLDRVSSLHHAARNLHATLQAAREAIPDDHDLIDLRDRAYELERTLDLLYTDSKHALDFYIARKAEEEARISRQSLEMANRLNVLAAIFFPLMALSSILGMNLPSGLEHAPSWTFWIVLLAGILLGAVISGWVLRGVRGRRMG